MFFASDNWAGAHPSISAALAAQADGFEPAYGNGPLDQKVTEKFAEVFEREVAVFFVATGTAANSLSWTLSSKPGGFCFCHRESHMMNDECGAPEYLSGGARLSLVDGELGRIDVAKLDGAVRRYAADDVHAGRPAAVSITQSSEVGTVYGLAGIDAIAAITKAHGMPLHMDGARFANALVSLGCTPAEMTWKRGVDIVSFGGTKNGCWCAEAVILFDLELAREFAFIRKRAAQLFSKSRFIAAQFQAYFDNGLWLETARHANAMSSRLAGYIDASKNIRLAWQPQANEVFAVMSQPTMEALQGKGARFYGWHPPQGFAGELGSDDRLCRFVTSFATTADEVDRFGGLIA